MMPTQAQMIQKLFEDKLVGKAASLEGWAKELNVSRPDLVVELRKLGTSVKLTTGTVELTPVGLTAVKDKTFLSVRKALQTSLIAKAKESKGETVANFALANKCTEQMVDLAAVSFGQYIKKDNSGFMTWQGKV